MIMCKQAKKALTKEVQEALEKKKAAAMMQVNNPHNKVTGSLYICVCMSVCTECSH